MVQSSMPPHHTRCTHSYSLPSDALGCGATVLVETWGGREKSLDKSPFGVFVVGSFKLALIIVRGDAA
jgi:hypothetical protein